MRCDPPPPVKRHTGTAETRLGVFAVWQARASAMSPRPSLQGCSPPQKKTKCCMYRIERGIPVAFAGLVDTKLVRALWEGGASYPYILKRHPFGEKELRRMSREWDVSSREEAVEARGVHRSLPPGRPDLPAVGTEGRESSIAAWVEMLGRIDKPGWHEETFPLAEVAEALHNVASGLPIVLAAEAAGIAERVLQKYRNMEPRLETMFRRARAISAKPLVEKIMVDRDWRAAAWLLERGIAKAEFKQEPAGKEDKLTIEILVNREDRSAVKDLIDVTESANGAMVVGLPSEREAEDLPRGKG